MSMLILQINDRCGPIARGEIYREPIEELFEEKNLGEVTGGGTQLAKEGGPLYCELELEVNDDSNSFIDELKLNLEKIGIPKGSKLFLENDTVIELGTLEGVGVSLNYENAPKSLLDEIDFEKFWEDIENVITPYGKYHYDWNGNGKVTVYYYGKNAEKIKNIVDEHKKGDRLKFRVSHQW